MRVILNKLIFFISLLFLSSCVGERLVPTKGPEGEPGSELNFAQFDEVE